ncbi:MAG TPA: leucyl aminopeptidase [Sporichthyaceae bacterium]|nr:leucyl aminopeptidase [Sporichthyaceae bacterium]
MVSLPRIELVAGQAPLRDSADVLAVPIAPGSGAVTAGSGLAEVARALGLDLLGAASREKAKASAGEIVAVPVSGHPTVQQVLLVGVGSAGDTDLRRAGAAVARRVRERSRLETTVVAAAGATGVRAFVEGLLLGSYSYGLRSGEPKQESVGAISVHTRPGAAARTAVERAQVTGHAVCLARDLANTPSARKTPAWLAAEATRVGKRAGLDVRVWEPGQLAAEGFGGLLAVGSGAASGRGPRLAQLSYVPDGPPAKTPHVVIVGKGITFDSGGLSLKPTEGMVAMKADMAGGAAVIATMGALRDLGIGVRVTGLVAAAENMPSGSAYRPGDIIRHYGGRTVEVLNTDAEGRLVLADALAYADARLDPDVIVDLATLTGAATLALSRRIAALFTDDDRLAAALAAAGDAGGDRVWRLPLVEDYRAALDSPVADLAHVPHNRKVQGGAITAALFLREFVGTRRWAHVDMAGPGKIDADEHENTKGGTGYGVRLLLRWLESYGGSRN